ncbi:DUF2510 domain-containing protein [Cellulomonas sp. KRMCY2]|uniref:DUF2510 domain-containing protein n=1 Tax=Cellulomonas sp. KRMCY2 TaxID=1304865 RepID=UPI0009DE7CCB|nr:DUF2510 domain-containing protein [Cellulomonas sp. KRMCY2]
MSTTPAGWYPDPERPGRQRWFDGTVWTEHVQPDGAPAPGLPAAVVGYGPAGGPPVAPWEVGRGRPGYAPQPGAQGPYGQQPYGFTPIYVPAPRKGWSPAVIVLAVVGGLVVLGILAAIAIPVFLNQRNDAAVAGLDYLSCDGIAADAVTYSNDGTDPAATPLVDITEIELVEDLRESAQVPFGAAEELVLDCRGVAQWSDGLVQPIRIWAAIDSEVEVWINWQGDY